MTNIKDYPELVTPSDADWVLIQENSTIPAYKKTQLINIKGSGGVGNSNSWQYRDGTVDFSVSNGSYLVSTPQDVTVDVSGTSEGAEIQLLKATNSNSLFIAGIPKIRGDDASQTTVKIVSEDVPAQLIYIDSTYGWLLIPSSSFVITSPLQLPTSGLIQEFNIANIQADDGDLIASWNDTVSSSNATQTNSSAQPTFKTGIFANNELPGLLFQGSQLFEVDFNYLANQKYTIVIVEARNTTNQSYILGHDNSGSNAALHVGYRGNTEFTLAQWDNDLNVNVSSYSSFDPVVWIVSNNSRGKEIYKNGGLISSNTNTDNLVASANGRIGFATGNYFEGYLGLIAIYTGDKSASEILEISNEVNSTFGVY